MLIAPEYTEENKTKIAVMIKFLLKLFHRKETQAEMFKGYYFGF